MVIFPGVSWYVASSPRRFWVFRRLDSLTRQVIVKWNLPLNTWFLLLCDQGWLECAISYLHIAQSSLLLSDLRVFGFEHVLLSLVEVHWFPLIQIFLAVFIRSRRSIIVVSILHVGPDIKFLLCDLFRFECLVWVLKRFDFFVEIHQRISFTDRKSL